MSNPILTANGSLSFNFQQQDSVLPSGVPVKSANTAIGRLLMSAAPSAIHEYSGTFTPNNDYVVVHQWVTHPDASLVIVITDKPVGIQVAGSVITPITGCTIDKIAVFRLSKFIQGVETSLYLDGRPGTNTGAVAQGVALNWYVAVIDDSVLP